MIIDTNKSEINHEENQGNSEQNKNENTNNINNNYESNVENKDNTNNNNDYENTNGDDNNIKNQLNNSKKNEYQTSGLDNGFINTYDELYSVPASEKEMSHMLIGDHYILDFNGNGDKTKDQILHGYTVTQPSKFGETKNKEIIKNINYESNNSFNHTDNEPLNDNNGNKNALTNQSTEEEENKHDKNGCLHNCSCSII